MAQYLKELDAFRSLPASGENQTIILFDLTHYAYLAGFNTQKMMQNIKILERLSVEKRAHVFLALRHDLLSNEYLYHIPRVLAIQPDSLNAGNEEQFSRVSNNYSVLFMYKSSSSKLEVEDRLQFSLSSGFSFKAAGQQAKSPAPYFSAHEMNHSNEAMILVEDSDRDSEGEMDADADF